MASEWLDNLKIGDSVIVHNSHFGSKVAVIERFTKTLIITKNSKFRRSDGCAPGNGWCRNRLQELTTERVNHIRKNNLVDCLKRWNWDALSLETLEAIREMLPESS